MLANSHFPLTVEKLRHGVGAKGAFDLFEGSTYMMDLVANHGDAEHNQLAVILGFHLSDRHVPCVTEAVLDALDHLPLVLQAA